MSATETKSNFKNLCFCCQENPSVTLLWKNEGSNVGSYGEMLQNCFNLQLDMSDTDVICHQCVQDLQTSVEFRNKVADTRAKFHGVNQILDTTWLDIKMTKVKQEIPDDDDYDNDVVEPDVIPIELEEPQTPKQIIDAEDFTQKDERYSCNKCDKKTNQTYKQIIHHLNVIHYRTCRICKAKFKTKDELTIHSKEHKKIICNSCDVEFSSEDKFKEHTNGSCNILASLRNLGVLKSVKKCSVKKDDNSVFSCGMCSKQFAKKRSLLMHQRVHQAPKKIIKKKTSNINTEEKITKLTPTVPNGPKVKYKVLPGDYTRTGKTYTCNKCQRSSNDYSIIMRHINNVHYQNKAYNCSFCPETFYSLHKLNQHKYTIHKDDEARFLCTACGKAFYTITHLNGHTKSYHMLGDVLKCNECDFQTYLKQGMRHHMAKHNREVKYFCSYCPKTFTRHDSHKYHERIHTGDKRKVCTVCGEKFVQRTSLKYHIMKHHPNADVK